MNLTINHKGLAHRIISQVSVTNNDNGKSATASVLWDTGATGSMLNVAIATKLNLEAVGFTKYQHADGITETAIYAAGLEFQGGLKIGEIDLMGLSDIHDFDMLIGMDIISRGDFRIKNEDGNSVFTFSC